MEVVCLEAVVPIANAFKLRINWAVFRVCVCAQGENQLVCFLVISLVFGRKAVLRTCAFSLEPCTHPRQSILFAKGIVRSLPKMEAFSYCWAQVPSTQPRIGTNFIDVVAETGLEASTKQHHVFNVSFLFLSGYMLTIDHSFLTSKHVKNRGRGLNFWRLSIGTTV